MSHGAYAVGRPHAEEGHRLVVDILEESTDTQGIDPEVVLDGQIEIARAFDAKRAAIQRRERAFGRNPGARHRGREKFFGTGCDHSLGEHRRHAERLCRFDTHAYARTEEGWLHEVVVPRIPAAVFHRHARSNRPAIESVNFADVAIAVAD